MPEWARGYVGALVKAGIAKGVSADKFGANDPVTREQLATFFIRAFGYDDEAAELNLNVKFADAAQVSDWAKAAVAFAAEIGFIKGDGTNFNPKAPAERQAVARLAYEFYKNAEVYKQKAEALFEIKVTVSATGVKTLKVDFGKAVDPSKAKFEVKKGSVVVNVSKVTFAADNKSATLELATKLTKGEYTVNVTGISSKTLSATVSVEDEKVAKIELLSKTAAAVFGTDTNAGKIVEAKIGFRVLNQYGEDITKSSPNITWTSSYGTVEPDYTNGVIRLVPPTGANFVKDQKVVVTGIEQTTGTVVSETLTIGDKAYVAEIKVKGLYHAENKELNTDSNYSEYYLLVEAKDQYGNKVNAAKFADDVLATTSNPAVINVAYTNNGKPFVDNNGPNGELRVQLAAPTGTKLDGTATIRLISKYNGVAGDFNITVKAAAKVDTFTLQAPATVVAAGETIEIPFTAVDQYGNEVTSYSALNGKVTLSSTAGENTLWFEQDYVNNKAVLKFKAPSTEGTYILMAITPTGKVSQLTVQVRSLANPVVVSEVKNVNVALLKDAELTLKASDIVVNDQYGRKVSSLDNNYKLVVSAVDGNADTVLITDNDNKVVNKKDITSANDKVVFKGSATKGSERFKVELYKKNNTTWEPVRGSEYEFTLRTVALADVAEFKVADIPVIYNASSHAVTLDVYGTLSDGTKVILPAEQYTVSTNVSGLSYINGKLDASGVKSFPQGKNEITGTVLVVFKGANGPVTVTKEVKVTNATPVVTTIKLADSVKNGVATVSAKTTDVVGTLKNLFTYVDQYGVNMTDVTPTIVITNVVNAAGEAPQVNKDTAQINGLEPGDTFNFTVIAGGKTATIKVVVTN